MAIFGVAIALTVCEPGNNNTDGNPMQTLAAVNTTFVCGIDEGIPATIARTPEGNTPIIRWKSDWFNK